MKSVVVTIERPNRAQETVHYRKVVDVQLIEQHVMISTETCIHGYRASDVAEFVITEQE